MWSSRGADCLLPCTTLSSLGACTSIQYGSWLLHGANTASSALWFNIGAGPWVVLIQPHHHYHHHHDLSWFAGPPEQSIEEEWQKLQEHPDILAAAPDDEVLAEMLAVQVSLYQCHHRQNSLYLALYKAYAVMANVVLFTQYT